MLSTPANLGETKMRPNGNNEILAFYILETKLCYEAQASLELTK